MTVNLSALAGAGQQFFSDAGVPLSGGKLYSYVAGTTTPQAAYTSASGATPHSNPIILNSAGRVATGEIWLTTGSSYKFILKTSDDVTIATWDNIIGINGISTTFNAVNVVYDPAGIGAVATNVQSKLRQTVSVMDFGAVGNGITDDTAAIQAAIAYCKTLTASKLIIGNGNFLVSSALVFNLPNYSSIEFIGTITSSVSTAIAVQIGDAFTNTIGLDVYGVKVQRTSIDSAGSSTGVMLRNISASYVEVRSCFNFTDGVVCLGDQANGGFSYNEIHLGFIRDNRRNVWLTASNGINGYCNENNFYGGTFSHSSGYPGVATVNLEVAHYTINRLNNNRFFGPSFEDSSALAVAATLNGSNNVIYSPRLENPAIQATYLIEFTVNTSFCSLSGVGFSVIDTNVSNLGTNNSFDTQSGSFVSNQAGTGIDDGALKLQTTFSSSGVALNIVDNNKISRFRVTGAGTLFSNSNGYFQTGIRFNTTSGTYADRGLFSGTGTPEGVVTASTGSLYCNASGGANTTLYVKETGSGNTGWVAK